MILRKYFNFFLCKYFYAHITLHYITKIPYYVRHSAAEDRIVFSSGCFFLLIAITTFVFVCPVVILDKRNCYKMAVIILSVDYNLLPQSHQTYVLVSIKFKIRIRHFILFVFQKADSFHMLEGTKKMPHQSTHLISHTSAPSLIPQRQKQSTPSQLAPHSHTQYFSVLSSLFQVYPVFYRHTK